MGERGGLDHHGVELGAIEGLAASIKRGAVAEVGEPPEGGLHAFDAAGLGEGGVHLLGVQSPFAGVRLIMPGMYCLAIFSRLSRVCPCCHMKSAYSRNCSRAMSWASRILGSSQSRPSCSPPTNPPARASRARRYQWAPSTMGVPMVP